MTKERIKDAGKYLASLGKSVRASAKEVWEILAPDSDRQMRDNAAQEADKILRGKPYAGFGPWIPQPQIDTYQIISLQEIQAGKQYLVQCRTENVNIASLDTLKVQLEEASKRFKCEFLFLHSQLAVGTSPGLQTKLTEAETIHLQDQIFHRFRTYAATNDLDRDTEKFLTGDLIDIFDKFLTARPRAAAEAPIQTAPAPVSKAFELSVLDKMTLRAVIMEAVGKYDTEEPSLQINGFSKLQRANDVIAAIEQYFNTR